MVAALNRKLARDLWRLRGQILAVALVVMCGIATFVTMRGMYETLVRERADYYSTYRFAEIFANVKRAPESVSSTIARIPGVVTVDTGITLEVTLDVSGLDEPATGLLVSVPEHGRPRLNDLHIRNGRYIEPGARDEVLVSEAFARANAIVPGSVLPAVINGRWQRLKVVGIAISPEFIYTMRAASGLPDDRRYGVLWMGRKGLAHAYDMDGAFNRVTLALARSASTAEVIEKLDRLLARYGALGAYGREDHVSAKVIADEIAQDRIYGAVLSGIFLSIAAFIIHIVLTRLVATQRDQVAVLKAFGYSNAAVGWHYLKLALAAIAIGVLLGLPLAAWLGAHLAAIYRDFFHFPQLHWSASSGTLLFATGVSIAAASVGAWNAVSRAVRLPPAEAMRPEAPARFRPGWIERAGFQRWLGIAQRMIIRNLERRPWKAVLTVIGIAFAVAILVVGRYGIDALDYIIDVEFRMAQRADVTVDFAEPLTASARHALARLPGVNAVEPFRWVPVRLRHEHRERRTAIVGLPPAGNLRAIIDLEYQRHAPPESGLLLSMKLASSLGVKPGDYVTVAALEGKRPVRMLPVAGIVDDLVGISAYMGLPQLNEFMGNAAGVMSGAYLAVDTGKRDALYRKLKEVPAVRAVAVREGMLKSFRDVIARSLTVQTVMNIIFACVIAFGVVYNSVRIALSERAHELASLRVLGLTEREVGTMLLGEQALLTLLAIPFGFGLGYAICAAVVAALNAQETFRLPLILTAETYAFAFIVVFVAALISGLSVAWRLRHLDLVAVLKAQE